MVTSGRFFTLFCLFALAITSFAYAATTDLVSISTSGSQTNDPQTNYFSVSDDGRYVAFDSLASNLVANDTNASKDIFVRDRQAGTTVRVSVASNGTQGNGVSTFPTISGNGQFVVFKSTASNLVDGNSSVVDVFVHELSTSITERVSVASDGTVGNQGAGGNWYPSISTDGRYVVFDSSSNNLTANDTNSTTDVFIHDRQTGTTDCISKTSSGTIGNNYSFLSSISANGQYVTFSSNATNLVATDTNGKKDILLHNRSTGTTTLVSLASDSSQTNGHSHYPTVSNDGQYVAFESDATNLSAVDSNGKPDVFLRDLTTGTTTLLSAAYTGTSSGNSNSSKPFVSADGNFILFGTNANNLLATDTNQKADVFSYNRIDDQIEVVSLANDGSQGNFNTGSARVNSNGRFVPFQSSATNLVATDTNGYSDIFLRDRAEDIDGDGYQTFVDDCDDTDEFVYNGATEIKFDGIDQDCNGYDLTLVVTASYKANKDTLTVEATSDLGATADLTLEGYGPMTFSKGAWEYVTTGNPGTVTVTGIEGSVTETVQ